jgi:hypothetical protein
MWEIPALAILNELRSRQVMKGQGRFVLDVLYARAKVAAALADDDDELRWAPSLMTRREPD